MTSNRFILTAVLLLVFQVPVFAQNVHPQVKYSDLAALPVPVTDSDIVDRPYRVLDIIEAGVRKATVFSKDPSRAKVYRELWERAQRIGADAVLKAEYGEARVRGLSWGSREAIGLAVKFLTDSEIEAQAKSAPMPKP